MHADQIASIVGHTPHTSYERGRELHEFIIRHRLRRCLELGFAHGVGTVWMAGAIQELGAGKVVAIDITAARSRKPSADELVSRAGLQQFVELHFEEYSYTWHLQRRLAEYKAEPFDFIFVDGEHNWDTDGFAFFLCEKILKPGGWILFDDLNWSYASSAALKGSSRVREMSEERRNAMQVRTVWEKLVLDHPAFGNFTEDGDWGWAQKSAADAPAPHTLEITSRRRSLLPALVRRVQAKLS